MAEQFARKTSLFGDDGINFNVPVDLCPETQYPYTLNVYSSKRGTVQTRPGLTLLSSVTAARVAAKRVNNSLPGSTYAFQRFSADAAGNMYGGLNGDVLLDSGFSGSPPAFVTAAPAQSPETWLYAADKQRMRKFRCDQATVQNIGIFPPNKEPSAVLGPPQYKQLLFGTPTAGGIAGVPGAIDRIPASTTIRAILYDVGTTGWCCLAYTNASNDYSFIGRGAQATYGGTEASVMEQVFTTLSATTVAGIHYDSGSTGLCTIQMSTPFTDLERNQMLQFPSEYVRVLSVTKGPDGLYSFRCSTVGTISAGNSITSIPATRTYLAATHAAGETVQAVGVSSVFTLAPTTTQGIGYLTVTSPLDLSQINGRPVTIDDYMHISIRVDHPELVLFGRVLLDVDAVTNDFTHNFYYQPFEHNDFTAASQGTSSQTASQQASIGLQQTRAYDLATFYEQGGLGDFADAQKIAAQQANPYADYPISTSMQAVTGSSVWTEFLFKISELQRVGSDETRNLANVKAFRLELTVSGTVTVSETAWWVGGTFGPDVLDSTYGIQGFPILARYRYRNSQTGAISVQSPALRAGVVPRRQNVWLTGTPSPDPQVDYIDWEVFGGAQEGWHYAGTGTNTTDPYIFDLTTTAVLANDPLSSVAFPPVPASDSPKHAIVSVVGTAVTWVSGDPFNPKWAAGGTMHIGTKAYTLYAPPASATFLTTVENVGTLVNANFVFAEPTLLGQSVPLLWGPDQQGRYFYAGDPYNPGNVYPSNADADGGADGVSDQTVVVVSSPSDPVMNGAVIEDVSVVLTSNTLQRLQPTPAADTLSYTPIVLETGKGLYARWGMVVSGTALYYVGNQGIYRWTQSTGSVSITEERLAPLFPHASIPGRTLTLGGASSGVILHPPDYSQPDLMRLGAANGYILFDYVDTVGTPMTLAYREANGSWWPWQYIQPPPTTGFVNDAMLTFVYQFTTPQTTDAFPHAAAWGCHEFLSNPGVFNAADTNSTVGIVTGSESLFHYSTNYTDYGIPSTPANDALWANRNDLASAISLFAQTTFYFFISSECTPTNAPLSPEADLDVYACYIDLSLASGATVRMWA
jgi:hypothetical protein